MLRDFSLLEIKILIYLIDSLPVLETLTRHELPRVERQYLLVVLRRSEVKQRSLVFGRGEKAVVTASEQLH